MFQDLPMSLDYGREVLETEARAVQAQAARLDERFLRAVQAVLGCSGRVVVSGMGKAGIIGEKIAATLASTGTPAHFVHPAEALHGDLGKFTREDVALLLSNSGSSAELVQLLPTLKKIGVRIVAITGNGASPLAHHADIVLDMGRIEEACPLGLAPSASTTAMLALGDALALTVLKDRKFSVEDYARYHPAGALGRGLLLVDEAMRRGADLAAVGPDATVRQALLANAAAKRRTGATVVVDGAGLLLGIFTDGDLRRLLTRRDDVLERPMREVMTARPKAIALGKLAAEAMRIMRDSQIDELPVVDAARRLAGLIDIQDLVALGLG